MAFACVPEVFKVGSESCFSSAVLPQAGHADWVEPRTRVSKVCWQEVQTKSNIGILAVSLCVSETRCSLEET